MGWEALSASERRWVARSPWRSSRALADLAALAALAAAASASAVAAWRIPPLNDRELGVPGAALDPLLREADRRSRARDGSSATTSTSSRCDGNGCSSLLLIFSRCHDGVREEAAVLVLVVARVPAVDHDDYPAHAHPACGAAVASTGNLEPHFPSPPPGRRHAEPRVEFFRGLVPRPEEATSEDESWTKATDCRPLLP